MTSTQATAWNPFGPKSFEDCLLNNMKGVTSDQAANAVIAACKIKFPTQEKNSTSVSSNKIKCGKYEVDKTENSRVEFPHPNKFGQLKIVKLGWEETYKYSETKVFKVYIQHSYPFDIGGFYLQGFKSDKSEDLSYYCLGNIGPNKVGFGTCSNVQSSSRTFAVSKVVTPSMNVLDLLKQLNEC